MANLLIRNLPEEAVVALRAMAASQAGTGRSGSLEGLARKLLVDATKPRKGLGTEMFERARRIRAKRIGERPITDQEIDALFKRSEEVFPPATFE